MKIKQWNSCIPIIKDSVYEDYPQSTFISQITLKPDGYNLTFNISSEIADDYLNELRMNGYIEYVYHVECSATSYRIIHKTTKNNFTFSVNRHDITKNIDIVCQLVTAQELPEYCNPNAGGNYKGLTIPLAKHLIIGIGCQKTFKFNEIKTPLSNTSSIFSIMPNLKGVQTIDVDTDKEKIRVYLPKDAFDLYKQLSRADLQPIIHSMILIDPLVQVLEKITQEDCNDCIWAVTIKKACQKLGIDIAQMENDSAERYKIAQQILGSPVTKGLETLYTLAKGDDEDEA